MPAARTNPRRQRLFRIAALLLGLLAAFATAELAIRAYLGVRYRGQLDQLSRDVPSDPKANLTLGHLIHPVDDPGIVFRLKPNARGLYANGPVHINSMGWHDDEFTGRKAPGTFRILVLGDSNSFAWGLPMEMGYAEVLEDALSRTSAAGHRVEVLNTSVPGYNAAMEVEVFLKYGLRYEPDLVLIQYSLNDDVLSAFLQDFGYTTRFDRLYLLHPESLGQVLGTLGAGLRLDMVSLPESQFIDGPFVQDPTTVPARYRHLVGPEATAGAYARLARACAERSIPLYCLLPTELVFEDEPDWNHDPRYDAIRAVCAANQIPVVDPFPAVREFVIANNLSSYDMAFLPPADMHPNAMRHVLTAMALFDAIVASEPALDIPPNRVVAERQRLRAVLEDRLREHLAARRPRADWDYTRSPRYIEMKQNLERAGRTGGPIATAPD